MRRLAILTTSLLAATIAFGGTAAFAANSDTVYPEDGDFIKSVVFSSLTDYAVNGEEYAFAEGKKVSVYKQGNLSEYNFENRITALDCSDGVFYCSDAEGGVYSLPYSSGQEEADYTITKFSNSITIGDFNYFLSDGSLKISDYIADEIVTAEGSYSNLKVYENVVYAVRNNAVYRFKGSASEKINLDYADYTVTAQISVGQAPDALKNYGSLKFVTVDEGAYMTEVDLTSIEDEFFVTGATSYAKEDTVALLLCYTGNAAVIAVGDESYILLKSKTHETNVNCYTQKEFDNATVIGNRIYASPYVIIGTSAVSNASGTIVSVLNKLEYEGVLGSAFYEVIYNTENGTRVGYVADGFLTEYIIEDNKPPETITDPEYSEEDNVKTVLLVFAVVVLVLAAVGYLAYIGISDKRKKKDKGKTEPDKKD